MSGSIGNVQVAVEQQLLVTNVSGQFAVSLELGARASDATDITFSEFSLVRVEDGTPVLTRDLSVVSTRKPPIRLNPGDKTTVSFEIGDQTQAGAPVTAMELDKDDYATICGAGSVRIVATMHDSVNGERPQPLSSGGFTPSGC